MRKVKLNLPAQASETAVKNVLKALSIRVQRRDPKTGQFMPVEVRPLKPYAWESWDDDVDVKGLIERTVPHQIIENGVPKTVSVKLNTLEVFVDDEGCVVGYTYEES